MKKKIAKKLAQSKRKIQKRLDKRSLPKRPGPVMQPGNIHYLHLLLIDLITKKDDLLVFVVNIHFGKSLQASFAGSARESGRENSCLDDQCNCCVNDFDIICHDLCLELNRMMEVVSN